MRVLLTVASVSMVLVDLLIINKKLRKEKNVKNNSSEVKTTRQMVYMPSIYDCSKRME